MSRRVALSLFAAAVGALALAGWSGRAAAVVHGNWGDSRALFMPSATPTPTALPEGLPAGGLACPGDCGGNRLVTVDELVTGVGIVLGQRLVASCRSLDTNNDGRVAINELVAAVSRLLFGCDGTPPTQVPTPTRTPAGPQSVCGGPITSAPKLCNLTIMPPRVRRNGNITISFGISDLEGDITSVCAAIAPAGAGTPQLQCMTIQLPTGTINVAGSLDPIPVGLDLGSYVFALQFRDRAGNASAVLTAAFEVIFIRV